MRIPPRAPAVVVLHSGEVGSAMEARAERQAGGDGRSWMVPTSIVDSSSGHPCGSSRSLAAARAGSCGHVRKRAAGGIVPFIREGICLSVCCWFACQRTAVAWPSAPSHSCDSDGVHSGSQLQAACRRRPLGGEAARYTAVGSRVILAKNDSSVRCPWASPRARSRAELYATGDQQTWMGHATGAECGHSPVA